MTHFWHKNILKYQPDSRPYADVGEKNEALIDNWNSVVGEYDHIYHLGDLGFCSDTKMCAILERLNGVKYLIRGNHDGRKQGSAVIDHFNWVKDYYQLKGGKAGVILSHYPIYSWNRMHYGAIHLYGHTHGQIPYMHHMGMARDVGADMNACTPFNLDELIEDMTRIQGELGIVDPRARGGRPDEHGPANNQCEGCAQGMPVMAGIHRMPNGTP